MDRINRDLALYLRKQDRKRTGCRSSPMLERAIARVLDEPMPAGGPSWREMCMRGSIQHLRAGGLTRRMVEFHLINYLLCKEELALEVPHG